MAERPLKVQWVVGSISHGGPLSNFSFQPVLYDWYNRGHGMCYLVCGMVNIKESERGAHVVVVAGFLSRNLSGPLPCPTPHNRKIKCAECVVK